MKTAWLSRPRGLASLTLCTLCTAAALTAPLAVSGSAAADEPSKADLAKARTLFTDAVALAAANDCAGALAKYKLVAQVKVTAQVAFNTAECEARLGKLVSALGNYRVAASMANEDKRAAAVLKEAPSRIDDLESRIAKLTLTRPSGGDPVTIELDGSEISAAQLGTPIPVDPGPHTIVVRVGKKEYMHETISLGEKAKRTFEVRVTLPSVKIEVPVVEPPAEPPPPPAKSRVPGVAVTIAGGAVLVTGLGLLGARMSDASTLASACNSNGMCPVSDASVESQGKLFNALAIAFIPIGAIVTTVGIVLIAKAGPQKAKAEGGDAEKAQEKKDKDAVWRSLQVGLGAPGALGTSGGLSLSGRF
jgi:hypothetical protein